jgi:hypothetical protein
MTFLVYALRILSSPSVLRLGTNRFIDVGHMGICLLHYISRVQAGLSKCHASQSESASH